MSTKYASWKVMAAVLYNAWKNNGRGAPVPYHYTSLAHEVVASGLSRLGETGETPAQTLNRDYITHRINRQPVFRKHWGGYWELASPSLLEQSAEIMHIAKMLEEARGDASETRDRGARSANLLIDGLCLLPGQGVCPGLRSAADLLRRFSGT